MGTSARAWMCLPIIRRGECRYRDRSRPIPKKRSISKMTSRRYSKKLSVDDGASKAASLIFTTEAQSSPSSEYFLIMYSLLHVPCVSALKTVADPCFGGSAVISPALLLFTLLLSGTARAQTPSSWEQIVAAAKKEGAVAVIGPQGNQTRDALTQGFQTKYPEINVELMNMAGNQIGPKLLNELTASRFTTDVIITGTTTALETLVPAKAVAPIK